MSKTLVPSPKASPAPVPADSAGPRSRALFARAKAVTPGGVHSPVRAFRAVGGTPLFLARGEGAEIEDADGHRYLDFVGSWGPLILGHAHPEVLVAVAAAARQGMTFGAPCAGEVELAEAVVARYPGLEQVRFVSSGTEATMSAIRLARGATGRDLIVKFAGCYHGHADHLLVAAGSGLVTFGRPSSAGVPAPFAALTRVLPLDDEAALDELFSVEGERIAAVIIEPVPANNGLLLQRVEFLRHLRAVTARAGALLIFDEVISGFRVARGGAAELYGLTPDLATFGKILGGGMPVGAFGGRRDLMQHLAPEGDVYQAGTLSGNPVAMAAGLATLAHPRPRVRLVATRGARRRARARSRAGSRCGALADQPGAPGLALLAEPPGRRRAARAPTPSLPTARRATGRSSTACSRAAWRSRPRLTKWDFSPSRTAPSTSSAWLRRSSRLLPRPAAEP